MSESIQQCKNDRSSADLNSLHEKAGRLRIAADGLSPGVISSNDTFPLDAERPVIAKSISTPKFAQFV
jgi:hypothetical protein